ncbi:MAG: cupin domain-containing protein [Theionarchaea archaeon]|nr:cupin domain-containing protein [Theionarchaea archaeon]MBU7000338.1 cupin domain-containing protein [Theionarchaea archaeon]MBU7020621.1 cupin domain-containing protein [Theionarchaea archaeon]MBU7035190.1 cupin domain-containing protein [Theionarchaea archaeon]MBU7040440.1 cupin domain-containing protein [Theionarchaea archaeon]
MNRITLQGKLDLIHEFWTPKIIAELNGQYVKLAKAKGEMVWHSHQDEDELFLVIRGKLTIELRDREINLTEGDIFIVPKGIEHRPIAREEAHILLFEPIETKHTGNIRSTMTVENLEWI